MDFEEIIICSSMKSKLSSNSCQFQYWSLSSWDKSIGSCDFFLYLWMWFVPNIFIILVSQKYMNDFSRFVLPLKIHRHGISNKCSYANDTTAPFVKMHKMCITQNCYVSYSSYCSYSVPFQLIQLKLNWNSRRLFLFRIVNYSINVHIIACFQTLFNYSKLGNKSISSFGWDVDVYLFKVIYAWKLSESFLNDIKFMWEIASSVFQSKRNLFINGKNTEKINTVESSWARILQSLILNWLNFENYIHFYWATSNTCQLCTLNVIQILLHAICYHEGKKTVSRLKKNYY